MGLSTSASVAKPNSVKVYYRLVHLIPLNRSSLKTDNENVFFRVCQSIFGTEDIKNTNFSWILVSDTLSYGGIWS